MDRPWYRRYNWMLAIACVLVSLIGVVMIRSATMHYGPEAAGEWKKQLFYIVAGAGLMFGFSFIDYHRWQRWWVPMYLTMMGLLAFILVAGHGAKGAVRWISLGPLGTFQPSEPAKFILAIALAALLCRGDYRKIQWVFVPIFAVAIPAFLILKQPDLGTALVVFGILTAELFLGLPNLMDFAIYLGGTAAVAAFVLSSEKILKPFQRARLTVFLDPNVDPQGVGYNLNQSKIAVGSGELFGKGLFKGTQTQLNYVPEHDKDFIFTVLGEELGFVGALVLIVLYGVILFGGVRSVFAAKDRFGVLLAGGLVAMLAFHVVVNIGMTIGIMPITGIPLPFMSYGGSAVLTDFAAVGVLLNIQLQKDKFEFSATREVGKRRV